MSNSDIQQALAALTTLIVQTNTKLDSLKDETNAKLDSFDTNFDILFKATARRTLSAKYGTNYVKTLKIQSLLGLARISFPKKVHIIEE